MHGFNVQISTYYGRHRNSDNSLIGCLQVYLAHMSLQSLVKLLMAGIAIAATIPGIIYSQSVSPAVNATLLAGQVQQQSLRLCSLCTGTNAWLVLIVTSESTIVA